jgi:hypothetical protein
MIFDFFLDLLCEDFIVFEKFLALAVVKLLFAFKDFIFLLKELQSLCNFNQISFSI